MGLSDNFVYRFGKLHTDGNRKMKQLLGGKGANLAEMSTIGIPVPPGFTISTEACKATIDNKMNWPDGLDDQIRKEWNMLSLKWGLNSGMKKILFLYLCVQEQLYLCRV